MVVKVEFIVGNSLWIDYPTKQTRMTIMPTFINVFLARLARLYKLKDFLLPKSARLNDHLCYDMRYLGFVWDRFIR